MLSFCCQTSQRFAACSPSFSMNWCIKWKFPFLPLTCLINPLINTYYYFRHLTLLVFPVSCGWSHGLVVVLTASKISWFVNSVFARTFVPLKQEEKMRNQSDRWEAVLVLQNHCQGTWIILFPNCYSSHRNADLGSWSSVLCCQL